MTDTLTDHDIEEGELPEGWESYTLGEVAKWGSGGTPKSGVTRYYGGDIPWAVIRDLNDDVVLTTESSITDEGLNESSAKMIEPGSILVAMYGSIGKLGLAGQPMSTNQAIAFANPLSDCIAERFLFYFLMSQRELLLRAGKGATQQNISQTILKSWPISVPPLEEQGRIVEILEDQLSHLDTARHSLHAVRKKAAQFRRSLLHATFTGALTGHDVEEGQLPEGWELGALEGLLDVSIGGIWGKEEGTLEVDVDVIRVTELKAHGVINPATAARRSITHKQLSSRSLQEGDLLLEKSGGGPKTPVGRVGYIPKLDSASVCSNFMQLMRPNRERVLPVFLHLFLTGFHSNGGTVALQTATTNIRNIKSSEYLATTVPLPSLEEQERIVEILEDQLSRLDASLAVVDAVEERSEALRRSLLHSAFTGRLTEEWREAVNV